MTTEIWDVYDADRHLTGETMLRGSAFAPGAYHLVIHVIVFNPKGEMLIQQRQPFKHGWSNMWDLSCGGSAVAGDTSQTAAARELFEEIGLRHDFTGQRPHMTHYFDEGFDDNYIIHAEPELESLTLQYEEVQAVQWAGLEEILQMIDEGTFIPYFKSYIALLFEMWNSENGDTRER
ncbi:MAG: NUDIX domain-containing protein [Oscillospiraceae bacterium]|jgi:isopentenyldiphosphate isomerase|nr:NUDIX domain-containing protein [Oscillospiraceae bacterium]